MRAHVHDAHPRPPAYASIERVVAAPQPEVALPEDPTSAAGLLEQGFVFFRTDNAAKASEAFRAAIATGHLNDAGRTLAYWHIYLAERSLGNIEAGADALASFIVVGQEVIDVRHALRYAVDESGDFVDRFDLERRLARARATLSAIWAGKVDDFGRSPEHPVLVRDEVELEYFLDLVPACQEQPDRIVVRSSDARGTLPERVTITCGPQMQTVEFFIEGIR